MRTISQGTIPFVASAAAQGKRITTREPITNIILDVTGNAVVPAGGCTYLEDNVLRLLKRIVLKDGKSGDIKNIGLGSAVLAGSRIKWYLNRYEYGQKSPHSAPSAAEGTNAFTFQVKLPCQLPPNMFRNTPKAKRRSTILTVKPGHDIDVEVDFCAVADISATASFALSSVAVEVLAEVDDTFVDKAGQPVRGAPLLLKENTQALSIQAAVNTADTVDVNRLGRIPYALLMAIDNGLLTDTAMNNITLKSNGITEIFKGSWGAIQRNEDNAAGMQQDAPTGIAPLIFDKNFDGRGMLNADKVNMISQLEMEVDHDALTSVFGLAYHHSYLEPVPGVGR